MYLSSISLLFLIAVVNLSSGFEQCRNQCSRRDSMLSGSIVPVFVTFTADAKADTSPIPAYAQFMAANNVKTVLVNGLIAGGSILAPDENKKIALAWVKAAKRCGLSVIVEVGGYVFEVVLELARYAKMIGADAIITSDDSFFKKNSTQGLVDYVKAVADAAYPLKTLYYHTYEDPDGLNMASFVPKAMDQIPNFAGIKTDFITAQEVQASVNDDSDVAIIVYGSYDVSGPYTFCMDGTSTPQANVFPRWTGIIKDAISSGDVSTAVCYQKRINRAISSCLRLINSETRGRTIYPYSSQIFRKMFIAVSGIKIRFPPSPPLPWIPDEIFEQCVAELGKQGLLDRNNDYYENY